jgi:alkylation response protein AidB-like acyl-CoA dehydrogenase
MLDVILIAEALGRLVAPGPFVPTNVVAATLSSVGSDAQRAETLASLLAGDVIAAWALTEPGGSWDGAGMRTVATRTGDVYTLSGVKTPVEAGAQADVLLVTARTLHGLTQFLVPRDAPGVSVTPLEGLDLVRRFATVTFDGVTVPASAVVGGVGDADADVDRQLARAVVMRCAETAGATERTFEFTLEYAADRYSFGRPLASYQALKHRFADSKMVLEVCHAAVTTAARAVEDDVEADECASIAKSYVDDKAPEVIQDCVQIHGGIGVTWEHDLHLYLRRVTQNRALYGTPSDHRERLAVILGM